jgi:hypothetical protein
MNLMLLCQLYSSEVLKLWGVSPLVLWGGGGVYCMRDLFSLNEIWVQVKIYILIGTLLC